jgi:pilus assembly protein Flp/PilA
MTTSAATDQRGATATEYALLIALIGAVIVSAVFLLGGGVTDLFEHTNASIDNAVSP